MQDIETKIAAYTIALALKRGFLVSIEDEEDVAVHPTTDRQELLSAMGQTDLSWVVLWSAAGERLGSIVFVHGNGVDVIGDYTDREEVETIAVPAMHFAEALDA